MLRNLYILSKKPVVFLRGFFSKQARKDPFKKNEIIILSLLLLVNLCAFSQCLKDLTDTKPVTISALTQNPSFGATNAFDNNSSATGGWSATHNAEPGNECWIRVFFSTGVEIIKGYSISALDDNSGNNNKAPADWKLQGSNDGSSWADLDSRSGVTFATPGETHVYSFNNSIGYNYYRVFISQTVLPSATQVAISEIQLFAEVCITGTVFQDNGDRLSAFNSANDLPLAGIPVSIVTTPLGNIVASTTTGAAGTFAFASNLIPTSGSFSVIVNPPAGKVFVTRPADLWSSHVVLPSIEDEPPTGSVFFDYHLNTSTNSVAAVNRMRFVGGNLDFGLTNATPPPVFTCASSPGNLITEADNGHFGNNSDAWETAHPHQKGYSYSGNLYYNMPAACTDYIFSNTTSTSGSARGVLYGEGEYAVTSFPGTLSDIAYAPYMSQMLNNVSGGWRKSFGTTTADVNDKFLAVNGATTGSLPFFKQTNLNLTSGTVYTLAFYGKHANSYAQGSLADAQIVIEVLDNANSVVTSGSLNLSPTTSFVDDRPEAPWQLRMFSFTAPGGTGPFTVRLRASTTAAVGNDFYIDDIVLYPCSFTIMPLQLTNFSASPDLNNDVKIGWEIKTALSGLAETEYSTDGKNFFPFGFIRLNESDTKYQIKHRKPGSGIHYYRLKITDVQGKSFYSPIRKVEFLADNSDRIMLYPNPVIDKLYIQSGETVDAYEIVDASGKSVRSMRNNGSKQFQIDARSLFPGIYYIKLVRKEKVSLHKIVINK